MASGVLAFARVYKKRSVLVVEPQRGSTGFGDALGDAAEAVAFPLRLDVATGATTAGLPIKAIDISADPENSDVASANTNVLVVIQNSIYGQKGAGLA